MKKKSNFIADLGNEENISFIFKNHLVTISCFTISRMYKFSERGMQVALIEVIYQLETRQGSCTGNSLETPRNSFLNLINRM